MNKLMIRHTMDKPLPYDAEVEYLESTGTQYIDTGINAESGLSIFCDFTPIDNRQCRMCAASKGTPPRLGVLLQSRTGCIVSQYGNTNVAFSNVADNLTRHTIINSNGKLYYDGDLIDSAIQEQFNIEKNLYIFASNSSSIQYSYVRIHSVEIRKYSTSELIGHFIPVRKGNTGYLYDKVSGRLFGNQGTGSFIVGPDYNPFAYQYLTFVPLEDSTFSFSKRGTGNDIEYSIDGGAWTALASGTDTPTVSAGHNIRWRAELTPSTASGSQGIGTFSASGLYDAMGNTMSLLYGDNFVGQTTLVGTYTFCQLWYHDIHIYRADRMVLAALYMTQNCYRMMFFQCSHLITAPVINAITTANSCCYDMYQKCTQLLQASDLHSAILTGNCYRNMYNGCSQLSYIKMLATDISASYCLSAWVSGVSPTGIFIKNAAMTTLPTGRSGIPSGWTVVDDPSTINS